MLSAVCSRLLRVWPAAALWTGVVTAAVLPVVASLGGRALAHQPPAQVPSAAAGPQGGPPCRVYPTSVVNTTVSPGSTVTLTYTGAHDANTHKTTYNAKYSDKAGGTYSYTQVVTYPSTAAFVDEVRVIPPVTLSATTAATGGVSYVLTHQYDAQGRLTGSTNTTGDTKITITYTAWDSAGRPTAGSNSVTGPLTIAYDDATRTATTKSSSGTQAQSYDVNGNPSTLVQTYGSSVFETTTSVKSTARVCK